VRLLVLGAGGMLGHTLLRVFADTPGCYVRGKVRDEAALARLPKTLRPLVGVMGDLTRGGALEAAIDRARPDVIVNAVGALKHVADPETMVAVNVLLPHRLARLAAARATRLIHIGTDCVFSGTRGGYAENDVADADDLYGRAKRLGEPSAPVLTLRTSLIGPELGAQRGLLGWFLEQTGPVPGYARAVFSGLPTITFAHLLRDHILPRPELTGVWHVSAEPISKLELLRLIAAVWPHPVSIEPTDSPVVDRSLDSSRFRALTGWMPPSWPDLVAQMGAAA
jgi:dTDP-4-dehydrorhamnose reductase